MRHYRHVVVHDSAKNKNPWLINLIEGSQRFYVSTLNHKTEAILSGIVIGYLPKYIVELYSSDAQLAEIKSTHNKTPQDLFIAWKLTNKGKRLRKLTHILQVEQD